MKTNMFILAGLLGFTTISGAILASDSTVADDSVIDDVAIAVPVSCTVFGNVNQAHTANISSGTYQADIGTSTFSIYCNDKAGFAVYAIGFSGDKYSGNNTKLIGTNTGQTINTGTATSGATSNWSMKIADSNTSYPLTLANNFGSYRTIPSTMTRIAYRTSGTTVNTSASGSRFTTTYASYMSSSQVADTYVGKVKYSLIHPNASSSSVTPQTTVAGYIRYYANAGSVTGTMGRQSATDGNTVTLSASNFSRTGYGFAGWSDAFDYETNRYAHFYGPNEEITVPSGTTANGLSLYAVWVKSAGSMQSDAGWVCDSLTAATYSNEGDSDESTWSITANLSSVSALTDTRDNQTYAIAKLPDGKCWMIENLRMTNKSLSIFNTNNPLNNGTNVTLKHNFTDTTTYDNLSATNSQTYNASSAPNGWCVSATAECIDQSRLRTDNTVSRNSYSSTTTQTADANLYSYGNYYNWYSATAGRGVYSRYNGSAVGDLCPFGWHLPHGTGTGEIGQLSNSLGGYKTGSNVAQTMNSSTSPTGSIISKRIRHFPNNFIYNSYVIGSSLTGRGSYGRYWASTVVQYGVAYNLAFSGTIVNPGTTGGNEYYGYSVRCVH